MGFSFLFLRKQLIWIIYFSLALCLVYSLFYLASYFGLSFFVLSNRGMVEHTVVRPLVSVPWDTAIWSVAVFVICLWSFYRLNYNTVDWPYRIIMGVASLGAGICAFLAIFGLASLVTLTLVSVLLIVLGTVFSGLLFGLSRFKLILHLLLCLVSILLLIEVAVFLFSNVPLILNLPLGGVSFHLVNVELSFMNLAYPFLPYLYLLFVLLGIVGFAIKVAPAGWLSKIRGKRFDVFASRLRGNIELGDAVGFGLLKSNFVLVLAVLAGAVVSCLFVLFTVLPWANPTNMLVSVDSPGYYQWIAHMRSVDFNSALSFAFANDRALFLVLAYALSFVVSPLIVLQFVSALLIVLFGVVCLFVLRLFCSFRWVWVFGVLLVPFSFQALGLIYSGYFANMLALILVFVYVVLFFRFLGRWSSLVFFALLGVSVMVLFSHSWTWFVFALSLVLFLFLEWRLAVRNRGLWGRFKVKAILVGATIGVGLFCDLIRKAVSPVSSSASVFVTAQSSLSIPNPSYLLSGLHDSVNFILGGVYSNGLLIFLSLVGFLVLLKFRSEVSNFFVAWIFVGCVSILFAAQSFVFDRFLFLMPWTVLSSLGLFFGLQFISVRFGRSKWLMFALGLILIFVFLALLNGSLRYLFNINIW